MINVEKGDKVVAKNDFEIACIPVVVQNGDVFTVTDIDDNISMQLSFEEDNISVGLTVTPYFFNEHFEKMKVDCDEDCCDEDECGQPRVIEVLLPDEVTDDMIEEIMCDSEIDLCIHFNKTVVMSCRLPNGYIITESCSLDEYEYDRDACADHCFEMIKKKVYEFEKYALMNMIKEVMYIESAVMCSECPNVDECEDAVVHEECDDDEVPDEEDYEEGTIAIVPRIRYSTYERINNDIYE